MQCTWIDFVVWIRFFIRTIIEINPTISFTKTSDKMTVCNWVQKQAIKHLGHLSRFINERYWWAKICAKSFYRYWIRDVRTIMAVTSVNWFCSWNATIIINLSANHSQWKHFKIRKYHEVLGMLLFTTAYGLHNVCLNVTYKTSFLAQYLLYKICQKIWKSLLHLEWIQHNNIIHRFLCNVILVWIWNEWF